MASKFMTIKKIVIPFMTLVIMASQLAGCAALSSQEMLKEMEQSPDVIVEWATQDGSQQRVDSSTAVEIGNQQFIVDEKVPGSGTVDTSDIGVVDQKQEVTELSGEALTNYFQLAYDSGVALEGDLEARIAGELDILVSLVAGDATVKLPGDYADQYKAWRPVEVQLFTDCNETVYATGTVNLRSSWSAESEKLGSLNKGDSVTRTGISIEGTEAEGWSRIQLSDGRIVYVSNKYLSVTKPTTQSSGGGGSTTQTKPQGQQGQQGGGSISLKDAAAQQGVTVTEQPTGKVWDQAFYDTLNPQQQAAYKNADDATRTQMKSIIESNRQMDQQGYQGEWNQSPDSVVYSWGNVIVN